MDYQFDSQFNNKPYVDFPYALLLGIGIAGLIIGYWYYWALTRYKWSESRLGSLMLQKYMGKNVSKLTVDEYFDAANVVLAADRKTARGLLRKKSKITQAVISRESKTYIIVTNSTQSKPNTFLLGCAPTEFDCIFV